MDKVYDELKNLIISDKPMFRKFRIMKYISCGLMIVIAISRDYYNMFGLIPLSNLPLLDSNIRYVINNIVPVMFWVWIVYALMYHNLYRLEKVKKYGMLVSYIDIFLDAFFTICFLVYSINKTIEFVNRMPISIKTELCISLCYIVYCIISVSYCRHRIRYAELHSEYTNYCDKNGKPIRDNSRIFYKGKCYRIQKSMEKYVAIPLTGEDKKIIDLELIASEGECFIYEKV